MPEIKNTFLQGKMNKDLDERLLPNGQYRNAINIEVSTSESSDVGTVKNILGNHRIENIIDTDKFTCVGSVANEKTNKLYWFVSSYDVDAIVEYDVVNDVTNPVLVDTKGGTINAVLKFTGNIITGINIIDDLLFWTDNNGEPKKINIEDCKNGTVDINTHTQLSFGYGSFHGITLDKVAPSGEQDTVDFLVDPPSSGAYFFVSPRLFVHAIANEDVNGDKIDINGNVVTDGNFNYDIDIAQANGVHGSADGYVFRARHYRNGEFLGNKEIRYFGSTTEEAVVQPNYPGADNGTHGRLDAGTAAGAADEEWQVGDILFGDNINIDIQERHITVVKQKPLNVLTAKINYSDDITSPGNIPNLFETKLPRFSYRYKYIDGEYSAFAPFTPPVFNPKYPKDTSFSSDTNIFYNSDNAYDIKEPFNKAMVNSIHSVNLDGFITYDTPEDVIEIDILYKQEESSVIYSIDTIRPLNSDWHLTVDSQGSNIGYNQNSSGGGYSTKGSYTKGSYLVTTENIYAALPENQLLRPWDNVPRKALAQEVTANRIVYGNYVQNYDILDYPEVTISYSDRQTNIGSFESQGLPHVKSQRNYQVGVVYCDEFGRETPVFTSKNGAVIVPWADSNGVKNASKSLQLNASVTSNFPEWVDSLKFFIKENSNEYYNLTMERAWVKKSTYELDNSEGQLWISFPSSDRNKISEEDYIILKKKIGTGEEQVNTENKFKVIDIKNEAPDALKYQLVNMGAATNDNSNLTALFNNTENRIDKQVDTIRIVHDVWKSTDGYRAALEDVNADDDGDALMTRNLYISWRRIDTTGVDNSASKKYKVIGGHKTATHYVLKLLNSITQIDADIAHVNSNSESTTQYANLHPDLTFQIEKNERRETQDFSGKFFVKISKNEVSDIIESGNPVNVLDQHLVSAKTSSWYWEDDIGNSMDAPDPDYGLTNYHGFLVNGTGTYASGSDSIHNNTNNTVGNISGSTSDSDGGSSIELSTSDYAATWAGIQTKLDANAHGKGTFFVDSMYMVAGQSQTSDYAKYSCVTWAGLGGNPNDPSFTATSTTESAWSYPPLKTWLSDFDDISNLITPQNTNTPSTSIWYEDNLISTSPTIDPNPDYYDLNIDGWVGPLQNVSRYIHDSATELPVADHVNGLEGLVTTVETHATGPRRWFSGITGSDTGVGVDTHVYSSENGETGRHFMHLSFFAPGRDLHDNTFVADPTLYGVDSWAANLQGIWGGGVFTGEQKTDRFGVGNTKHQHLAMEGNYAADDSYLPQTPGPGVGYGYNVSYRELHERQWDPTFIVGGDPENKIRDFIRNLKPGAQFRFNKLAYTGPANTDTEIYTIKDVSIKKLYNHTSWRKPYNRYVGSDGYNISNNPSQLNLVYQSVEEAALIYLNKVDDNGVFQGALNEDDNLKSKIVDFGKSHNRRVCYIIELDKNPVNSPSTFGNPLRDDEIMTADFSDQGRCDIEFLEPVQSILLSDLSKFPAIWEVDPKKKDVDLDIYYEASNSIPVKLNDRTNELFAPIGCRVEIIDSSIGGSSVLESWDGATASFSPGFAKGQNQIEINYNDVSFKFIREDGSYTIAESGQQSYDGQTAGFRTSITFKEDIAAVISSGLSWYNCFSFGNGIESNRIRDDFNEIFISNGVKASTTTQEPYKEERRPFGLIYSGLYNSNSGVNDLNQFIMAEKITKDLNPTYGSIQKLFQRRISLIAFCEDRVVSITSDKDVLFNADGNSQLVASNRVLGDATPFLGNYGISKNPESFASESYRAYFTDKQRGAVLRLSKDGLTPISKTGMQDFFRDNLPQYSTLLGTYDSYKENYNVTLLNNPDFNENFILDSYFETGVDAEQILFGSLNKIENPYVFDGSSLEYLYEQYNVLDTALVNSPFTWSGFTDESYSLTGYTKMIRHAEIPAGSLQAYVAADPFGDPGTPNDPYVHSFRARKTTTTVTTPYTFYFQTMRFYKKIGGTYYYGPPAMYNMDDWGYLTPQETQWLSSTSSPPPVISNTNPPYTGGSVNLGAVYTGTVGSTPENVCTSASVNTTSDVYQFFEDHVSEGSGNLQSVPWCCYKATDNPNPVVGTTTTNNQTVNFGPTYTWTQACGTGAPVSATTARQGVMAGAASGWTPNSNTNTLTDNANTSFTAYSGGCNIVYNTISTTNMATTTASITPGTWGGVNLDGNWTLEIRVHTITWDEIDTTVNFNQNLHRTSNNYNGSTGTCYTAPSPVIAEVEAVPPTTIPAWTEVQHMFFNDGLGTNNWTIDIDAYDGGAGGNTGNIAGNIVELQSFSTAALGPNYLPQLAQGLSQNSNVANAPAPIDPTTGIGSNIIEYMTPDPAILGTNQDVFGQFYGAVSSYGANEFDRVANANASDPNFYTPNVVSYDNSYIYIETNSVQSPVSTNYSIVPLNAVDIQYTLPQGEEFEPGEWYLLDIEFDETQGNGTGALDGSDGCVYIIGVLNVANYPNAATIAYNNTQNVLNIYEPEDGVGSLRGDVYNNGDPTELGVALIKTTRTEYGMNNGDGDGQTVLRAIFKFESGSHVHINGSNKFMIRFQRMDNGFYVNKIIPKKLSDLTAGSTWDNFSVNVSNAGVANDWTSTDPSLGSIGVAHAFDNKYVYYDSNKLCWEVNGDDVNLGAYSWRQDFNTPTTASSGVMNDISYSAGGWQLGFTLTQNPNSLNLSGKLRGFIAINSTPITPAIGYVGMYFSLENIVEGNYKISFNFDLDDSSWTIEKSNLGSYDPVINPWIDYSSGNTVAAFSSVGMFDLASVGMSSAVNDVADKLVFFCDTLNSIDQHFAINNIDLNDNSIVYLGGSAGSWSFDGFDPALNNYIYWDTNAENIVFNNCPPFDPSFPIKKFINVNQEIQQTINQFEKYKVSFVANIDPNSTATLAIYYYNSNGYGFKYTGIDSNTTSPFIYEFTIGEVDTNGNPIDGSVWFPVNQTDPLFNADLKNSFVIQVEGDEGTFIDGTIDNVIMKKIFTDSSYADTTITFSESVNGWTSFKDFIPENGVSVSRKYFTFEKAALYKHYVPLKYDDLTSNWNTGELDASGNFTAYKAEEAENYNRFYDSFYTSSVQAVLNQEPSLVKIFNTINYEGTQAYTKQPNLEDNPLTINNAIAISGDVNGWTCSEITTDLDSGSILEFIKKEGKWFNYIKGKQQNLGTIKTDLFSVQGLGVTSSSIEFDNLEDLRTGDANNNDTAEENQPTTPPPNTGNMGGGTSGGY